MRPVNLLPARYRPARASGGRSGIGYIATGALAVVLLMVVLYVVTQNGINDAKDKTAKAQAQQQEAQARIGSLQSYGDFAALKQSREAAVRGLAEVRFDWERAMREIALVLPKNVYLTSFTAQATGADTSAAQTAGTTPAPTTATGPAIQLGGCAPSHPAVAATVVRLRRLHNAVNVDLTSSTKGGGGDSSGGCKVTWAGTVTMKAESVPTAPQGVPARLGGGQ